jgi:hypothetical protein
MATSRRFSGLFSVCFLERSFVFNILLALFRQNAKESRGAFADGITVFTFNGLALKPSIVFSL